MNNCYTLNLNNQFSLDEQNDGVINTPRIDQLANAGVQFENYYVQSVCSPSRAALLTGKYPSSKKGSGVRVSLFRVCRVVNLLCSA